MNEIKTLLKYSKYVIPTLTLISLCKLGLFYSFFNIRISSYLGLEEVLTPFISDALIYLLFFFIPMIVLMIFLEDTVGVANARRVQDRKKQTFRKRFFAGFRESWMVWLTYLIAIIILSVRGQPIEYIIGVFAFLPVLNIIFWVRNEIMIKKNIELTIENVPLLNLSTLTIVIFLMIMSKTIVESYVIKNTKSPNSYIQLTTEKITFGDSISYIGNTKNYTFLYNKSTKGTTVIANSEIKKIHFSP